MSMFIPNLQEGHNLKIERAASNGMHVMENSLHSHCSSCSVMDQRKLRSGLAEVIRSALGGARLVHIVTFQAKQPLEKS